MYLSLDLKCPNTLGKVDNKEFKGYLNYLVGYFRKNSALINLKKNLKTFSSYPEGQVLNLTDLKI